MKCGASKRTNTKELKKKEKKKEKRSKVKKRNQGDKLVHFFA